MHIISTTVITYKQLLLISSKGIFLCTGILCSMKLKSSTLQSLTGSFIIQSLSLNYSMEDLFQIISAPFNAAFGCLPSFLITDEVKNAITARINCDPHCLFANGNRKLPWYLTQWVYKMSPRIFITAFS